MTYDGKWVLATTDTYLFLICTQFTDKGGATKSAFKDRGMTGKSSEGCKVPAPINLRLKPEDVALVGGASTGFRNGRFEWTVDGSKSEAWCVASRGPYTFAWNISRARRNASRGIYVAAGDTRVCSDYERWSKDERVVDSMFMESKYTNARKGAVPLVVVTEHEVYGADSSESDDE